MQHYVHPTFLLCYEHLLFDYHHGLSAPDRQQVVSFVAEVCLHFVDLCGQSLLCETKSSNEGQIPETLCGQSLLHKTKSSDKGQFPETLCGQNPLRETKFSDKGQILETLCG
jgi:hypothetical protein